MPQLSRSKVRFTGLLLAGLIVVALAVFPALSHAGEKPFRIDFDQSQMQIGQLDGLPLDQVASTGSVEGTIDDDGNVTIPKGGFKLPEVGITDPIKVKAFMGIESAATGTFNAGTGELILNAKAGIWVSVNLPELLGLLEGMGVDLTDQLGPLGGMVGSIGDLTCGFSPMDVTFTTGETSLGSGSPFTDGPEGAGALTAEWSKLGPFAGRTRILVFDVCQMIKSYAPQLIEGGLGGVLPEGTDLGGLDFQAILENLDNVDLGPSSLTLVRSEEAAILGAGPSLELDVMKKTKRVRAGRKAELTVQVRNTGRVPATGVKLCLKSAAVKVVNGRNCRDLGKVMAGATQTRRFKVKVPAGKKRNLKVKFTVRADNSKETAAGHQTLIRR